MLNGPHLAGVSHPRLHFIHDEQDTVPVTHLTQVQQETFGRDDVTPLTLDRLDEDPGASRVVKDPALAHADERPEALVEFSFLPTLRPGANGERAFSAQSVGVRTLCSRSLTSRSRLPRRADRWGLACCGG